jgi:DNA-binding GntR family transcriptional regulator
LKKRSESPRIQPLELVDIVAGNDSNALGYKDTAQNRAYISLKDAVLAGHFLPGSIVTLRRLSEMLGTSEMPVREAVKRLTAEGAFEALPNRSARIPKPSRRKILQILDLRIDLEGKAAEQATENISKRQIDELLSLRAKMDERLAAGDTLAYTAFNKDFHFLIYKTAQNEPLLKLIETLWLSMAPLLGAMIRISMTRPILQFRAGRTGHDKLIKAFQDRDPAAVKLAMQAELFAPEELPDYWDALDIAES